MHPINQPQFHAAKFRELVLYAAQESQGDERFGAVKLNKILFFADFLSFGLAGEAITGATYQRLGNGPAPVQMLPIAKEIEEVRDGHFINKPYFNRMQRRLVPLRSANMNLFSAAEIDLVDDVIRSLYPHDATGVSLLSHERSFAWNVVSDGETIPYCAVFLSARKATSADIERGQLLAREHGWASVQ